MSIYLEDEGSLQRKKSESPSGVGEKTVSSEKKSSAPYDFIVSRLKVRPEISFAELKQQGAVAGLTIYPIVYGRAKAALGLVPVARRGQGRTARKRRKAGVKAGVKAEAPRTAKKPASESLPRSMNNNDKQSLDALINGVQHLQDDNTRFRQALERIAEVVREALK
ncbi:MAG: hypothetical protein ACE5F1_21110 [Planctomycetota bacterium]